MLEYRRAQSSDAPVLAELRIEFMRIVKDGGIAGEAELRAELRDRFAAELSAETMVAWICLDAGLVVAASGLGLPAVAAGTRVAGGASGASGASEAGADGEAEALVFNMYTRASHRRRGIASELLRLCLEEGRARGVLRFRLQSTDDGRGLYERAGFVDEGGDMVLRIQGRAPARQPGAGLVP
ncbi:MAG TPA: GNAT family N-acetyltransferase [Rectinemataceae bacterium]|nr:GNAT family N-acetyltransferase [Rectinemataceae bacterium]